MKGWEPFSESLLNFMKQNQREPVPPKDVSDVNDQTLRGLVGYHLKRASNAVQADLATTLQPFELRMITYTALVIIVDNPGLRQSQLADAMDVERPNLVVIIDELEGRELIVRDKVPTDRRAYALHATLMGHQLAARALQAVKAHEAALLDGIDLNDLAVLKDVVGRVQKNAMRRKI